MNETNNETNPTYRRKAGIFAGAKAVTVSMLGGANAITIDSINTITGITGSTAVASGVLKEATTIFGNSIIEDLRANEEIDSIHRQIERAHANAELDRLKLELANVSAPSA